MDLRNRAALRCLIGLLPHMRHAQTGQLNVNTIQLTGRSSDKSSAAIRRLTSVMLGGSSAINLIDYDECFTIIYYTSLLRHFATGCISSR